MQPTEISLNIPHYAYLYGFIQTDGHLYETSRDRGKVTIEVSKQDESILKAFKAIVPFYSSLTERERATNFSQSHTSVIWRVYDQRFRHLLELWGLPTGCKSNLIKPPSGSFSEVDYFRGLVDGDGSLLTDIQRISFSVFGYF